MLSKKALCFSEQTKFDSIFVSSLIMVDIAAVFLLPLEQTILCLYQENKQFYLLFLFFHPKQESPFLLYIKFKGVATL